MAKRAASSASEERQRAHERFQKKMEAREQGSLLAKLEGWPVQKVIVGLAVCTLALGLAMLGIVAKLDVNRTEDVPPRLALASDGEADELLILQAEPGLQWSDLRLDGDCDPMLNGQPLAETPLAEVKAGDVLTCAAGETLQIHSTRERGDAILYRSTFDGEEEPPSDPQATPAQIPP